MGTKAATETEFNSIQFEKKLTSLKDSQDSINACCQWCLQNRVHHKKIVNAWLNVLKRVKVDQRLVLFYLANDVVQYSKRRNYEYVESWGTALQKATTLVRDDRVKHKILRIFKIWEQRGVYNEEFISDLCGLISVVPSAPKDETHEFQSNYVINKIKTCSNLESDTDTKLKTLKEHNPKIQIDNELCASLKDRAHVDDVEKEIDVYVNHMEDYINALKLEIKNRIALISVLKQAETQLESDRKDVKVVANAYKMFGQRVKTFQKKLEEHRLTLCSPVPSPDVNAPSPSPDSDIDLPANPLHSTDVSGTTTVNYDQNIQFTNAGYYNPVPPPSSTDTTDSGFVTNGFSTFMGSNLPFNLQNLNTNTLFQSNSSGAPPLPVEAPTPTTDYSYSGNHNMPLLPPPMPPFTTKSDIYSDTSYTSYTNTNSTSFCQSAPPNIYSSASEDYNPEQDVETWEPDPSWSQSTVNIETPESPPLFEKKSYVKPVEYHDNVRSGAVDVDHRVLHGLGIDTDDTQSSHGGKDVDHRNLIKLTGSPADSTSNTGTTSDIWSSTSDRDYRNQSNIISSGDQDYRFPLNIENLKLPPPPPPPSTTTTTTNQSNETSVLDTTTKSRKFQDNVESIDMDMSDDENLDTNRSAKQNLKVVVDNNGGEKESFSLEPPPPLPDLPDDVDANNFLDDLNNDLNEFSNLSDDVVPSSQMWQQQSNTNFPPTTTPPVNYKQNLVPNIPPPPLMQIMPTGSWMPEQNLRNWDQTTEWPTDTGTELPVDWSSTEQFPPTWPVDQQSAINYAGRGGRINNRNNFNNNFNKNGRNNRGGNGGGGRGGNFRGGNNFRGARGGNTSRRGGPLNGGQRQKGNFRGNFRGGF